MDVFLPVRGYDASPPSCHFLSESYWCVIIANNKSLLLKRGAILAGRPPPLFFFSLSLKASRCVVFFLSFSYRIIIEVKRCQCPTARVDRSSVDV